MADVAGIAIWASVSEEVDAKIREQVKAGAWPVRLKPEDWASGEINWLIDVIAPDKKTTESVVANINKVVSKVELRLHPIVARSIRPEQASKFNLAPEKVKD